MSHIFMNPRDYEDLKAAMDADTPQQRRVRKADRLLQQLGYTQIGRYDIAHRMQGVPILVLHGIMFIRPHYYAVVTAMANVLRAYKAQDDLTPLPNLEHLRLAEFIYHAPKVWWRSLDAYRAHIMTCAAAASEGTGLSFPPPTGRSSNFAQASGVRVGGFGQVPVPQPQPGANPTIHASPMVSRNMTYQVHNPGLGNAILPIGVVNLPIHSAEPATLRPYETPLFTWLLDFTSRIRPLSLNSAAVV